MGTYLQDSSVRNLALGRQVTFSWTLPAAAETDTIFTVVGGLVLVTSLLGQVTTLIGATTTTLELGAKPSTGTEEKAGIATATAITSKEVGTCVTPLASSGIAGALVVGTANGSSLFVAAPFTVNTGVIEATTSANAGAGVIKWYLTYVPLANGAYVHA